MSKRTSETAVSLTTEEIESFSDFYDTLSEQVKSGDLSADDNRLELSHAVNRYSDGHYYESVASMAKLVGGLGVAVGMLMFFIQETDGLDWKHPNVDYAFFGGVIVLLLGVIGTIISQQNQEVAAREFYLALSSTDGAQRAAVESWNDFHPEGDSPEVRELKKKKVQKIMVLSAERLRALALSQQEFYKPKRKIQPLQALTGADADDERLTTDDAHRIEAELVRKQQK